MINRCAKTEPGFLVFLSELYVYMLRVIKLPDPYMDIPVLRCDILSSRTFLNFPVKSERQTQILLKPKFHILLTSKAKWIFLLLQLLCNNIIRFFPACKSDICNCSYLYHFISLSSMQYLHLLIYLMLLSKAIDN